MAGTSPAMTHVERFCATDSRHAESTVSALKPENLGTPLVMAGLVPAIHVKMFRCRCFVCPTDEAIGDADVQNSVRCTGEDIDVTSIHHRMLIHISIAARRGLDRCATRTSPAMTHVERFRVLKRTESFRGVSEVNESGIHIQRSRLLETGEIIPITQPLFCLAGCRHCTISSACGYGFRVRSSVNASRNPRSAPE